MLFSDFEDDPRFGWLATLDLALELDVPLVTDDPGMRSLAREKEISTYSTVAVLSALVDDGTLAGNEFEAVLLDLARAYVVDLTLGLDAIGILAEESRFDPGPGTTALSRPSAWTGIEDSLAVYGRILDSAMALDRDLIWPWVVAGSVGFGSRLRTGQASGAGVLLGITLHATAASSSETRAALEGLRHSLGQIGVEGDPLDGMVIQLARGHLGEDADRADMVRLSRQLSGLDIKDQHRALEILKTLRGS